MDEVETLPSGDKPGAWGRYPASRLAMLLQGKWSARLLANGTHKGMMRNSPPT